MVPLCTGGNRGAPDPAGRDCTGNPVRRFAPHFLLKHQKKMPRPAKEKCFLPQILALAGFGLLLRGGCWLEALSKSGNLLPGALYPLPCGGASPHLAAWVLTQGGCRKACSSRPAAATPAQRGASAEFAFPRGMKSRPRMFTRGLPTPFPFGGGE